MYRYFKPLVFLCWIACWMVHTPRISAQGASLVISPGSASSKGTPATFKLQLLSGTNRAAYILQSSIDQTSWRPVSPVTASPGKLVSIIEIVPTNSVMFFRVKALAHAAGLADTNSPSWTNGVNGVFELIPGTGMASITWSAATDDSEISDYSIFFNGNLWTNLVGTNLTVQFPFNSHQQTDVRIVAGDDSGNKSTVLPVFILPGDYIVATTDEGGRIFVSEYLQTNSFQTNGGFTTAIKIAELGSTDRGLRVGDFDRDGILDIVGGAGGSQMAPSFLKGRGDGTFFPPVALPRADGANGYTMGTAVGDFDGDGNLDFVANGNERYVFFYWGKGDGTFSVEVRDLGNYGRGMVTGDFDGDGRTDLIRATYSDGALRLYLSNGDRTFAAPVQVGQFGSDPYGLAAGDFDEDGYLDLIGSGNGNGDIAYFKGLGNGSFTNLTSSNLWANLDVGGYAGIDSFDYDGDGHLDLVMSTYSQATSYFWAGRGDGTFDTNQIVISRNIGNSFGISAPPPLPLVDVNITPRDPLTNLNSSITFHATGSGVSGSDVFRWSFGDEGTNTLAWTFTTNSANNGATVTHKYIREGRFVTRLLHTASNGINSVRGTWVTVKAQRPVANPGGPYVFGEKAATNSVWFATLDGSASVDDFGIATYLWDFGDGTTSTNGAVLTHGWANAGPWTVTLVVVDNSGQASDPKTATVTFIAADPPVAVIEGPDVVDESAARNGVWSATFNGLKSTDDFGLWKYYWDFGNGQTATSPTATTTYSAIGSYVVTLLVTDNATQTNAVTHTVVVKANNPPIPVIKGPRLLAEDVATNTLWFGSWDAALSTDDTGIYKYNWSYGDGGSDSGTAVSHKYSAQGVYQLVLAVTDNGNQMTTVTQKVIVVAGELPIARITASPLEPEGTQPVSFNGEGSSDDHGIAAYHWILPPRLFDFSGQLIDAQQWASSRAVQDDKLLLTGNSGWGSAYFYSVGTQVPRGSFFEARVDTATGVNHGMVGFRNTDFSTESYPNLIYAFYFAEGDIRIYERGGDRGSVGPYTKGNSYDVRIESSLIAGAKYFIRPSGTGAPFVKVFESQSYSDSSFSFGADIHSGVFGFDDIKVNSAGFASRLTVGLSEPGLVTLEVTDNAGQTNLASVAINVITGAPPTAVISGSTNGLAGFELPFNAYGSTDDHGIASYAWDFGDGTPLSFGPAISHSYASAGVYTNTVTVRDFANQTSTASLVVSISGGNLLQSVPWAIIGGIEQPHISFSGKVVSVKAVARGLTLPFTNIWDFGDGSGTFTNVVTAAAPVFNLEAYHAYSGSDGAPYSATARLYLTNGEVLTATYPLILRPKTLDTEEKVAIDEGLWNLQKVQNRYDIDANNKGGSWSSGGYTANATASAVQAFAINGHLLTDDASRDPYVETVKRGVNHLFTQLATATIGVQPYGDPDSNQNGIGLTVGSSRPIYETGPVMDALVAVGRPELVAQTGPANVKGRTFKDIAQDMADMYAYGQYNDSAVGGGWRYSWKDFPDNSASQWGAIGLFAVEQYWGVVVPDWVKTRNLVWLNYSRGFGYTGPGEGEATTPSGLVQSSFDGVSTTNQLWKTGENYIANNWGGIMSRHNVYAHYSTAKALRNASPAPVKTLAATGKDWFLDPADGLARTTIGFQASDTNNPSTYGSWTSQQWVEPQLATAWSVLILSSSLFQQGPVAVANVSPNPSAVGYPVVFDARGSYHQHPSYKIVEYRWVFDTSKGIDFTHPDATGPLVTNVFGSFSTNTVALEVLDNSSPQLSDTAQVVVRTSIPPYPPTADAGGPYVAAINQDVHLDGSGSFTVDANSGNFIQSWAWLADYQLPLDFSQAILGERPVIAGGFSKSGPHPVAMRVKNANSLTYPGLGLEDLTSDAFTTVFVYDRLIPDLRARPKGNKIQLTWTKAGDSSVVVRSGAGPDRGFAEVGRTPSSYATFLDTLADYNTEYYYRVYAYVNGRPDPIGISDPVFVLSPPRSFDEKAPHFRSTPDRLAKVGELYEASLDARDPQNSILAFAKLSGPTNLTVNSTSGLIRYTPTEEQVGSQFVSFEVTNNIGRDVLSYSIFVFPATNHAPVVNVNGPYSALTGQTIDFSSVGTSDPDNQNLRYFWNFGDGSTSTEVNPQHAYGGIGDYLVSLFVNDGYGGTVSAKTHAVITRPNRAPVAFVSGGPSFSRRLGESLSLDGSASHDLDGDPITYLWTWGDGSPDSAGAKATHSYQTLGSFSGILAVSDNRGGRSEYAFTVTQAAANLPPVVDFSASTNTPFVISTVTFDAGATTDPENDPMSFEWDFGDRTKTTGPLVTHVFRQIGDFVVRLTVSDNRGGRSQSTKLIQSINAPPIFTSTPPLMVRATKPYAYTPTLDSVDGDSSTFQLVQGPATMSVDPTTGTLTWLPGTDNVGPNPVVLRATDEHGGTADQSFVIAVTVPLGPQIDLQPVHVVMTNVLVDSASLALSGTTRVYIRNNGTDPVPVPFTVSVFVDGDFDGDYSTNADRIVGYGTFPTGFPASSEAWIEMTVQGSSLFKDAPLYAFVDSQNVVAEYVESNNIMRSGSELGTNQPPVIDLSAGLLAVDRTTLPSSVRLTARLGNSGLVSVGTNVPMSFYDGNPKFSGTLIAVARSERPLAPGMYEDLSVNWPTPEITNHTVFVVAADPGTGTNIFVEITLTNNVFSVITDLAASEPPIADAGPNQTVNTGDTVALNGRGSSDPQGKPLSYRWSVLSTPIGSRATLTGTNSSSPSFQADASGQYSIQLVVNNGLKDSLPANVTVSAVDTNVYLPPSITSTPTFQSMVGVLYQYQVIATDPQNGSLTYRLGQGPAGMTINTNNGLLQWTPAATGSFFVQVFADGRGGSAFQSYSLGIIAFTNLPPQFTSQPVRTAVPSAPYSYTAVAVDPNRDTISYSLLENPGGMSINASSGAISWTPGTTQLGGTRVTVRADDGKGAFATQSYNLVVFSGAPDGPLVQPLPDQTVVEPDTFATVKLDSYVSDTQYPDNQIVWTFSGAKTLTVTIDTNRVATITYPAGARASEQITFLATDPSGKSGYSAPILTVRGADNPPIAAIANLSDTDTTSIETGFFELKGTADDPDAIDAVAYRVGLYDSTGNRVADVTPKPLNAAGWHEGRVSAGNSLGTLDFTTVRNGGYTLLLEVRGGEKVATAAATIALSSELKIGQLKFAHRDVVLPIKGIGLAVTRTYDSLNTGKSEFGYSWNYSISDLEVSMNEDRTDVQDLSNDSEFFSLRTGGGRDVTLTLPDTGRRVTFRFQIASAGLFKSRAYWTPPLGVTATLSPMGDATLISLFSLNYWQAAPLETSLEGFDFPGFILTTGDGTQYQLDRQAQGEHFYASDSSIGSYSKAYGDFYLSRVTDKLGNRTEFVRDNYQLQNIISYDPNNTVYKSMLFKRDSQQRFTEVYTSDNLDTNGVPVGPPSAKYEYDTAGNLVKAELLSDTSLPGQPSFSTTTYVYAHPRFPHLITEVIDPRGISVLRSEFDDSGRLIATYDAYGNKAAFEHNISSRVETAFDALGNSTQFAYDERGNVIAITDALGNTSSYSYDPNGRISTETDALGNKTIIERDGDGNPTSVTDALGNRVAAILDSKGHITSATDAMGHTTKVDYDKTGRFSKMVNALGLKTEFSYDTKGNLTSVLDINGNPTTQYQYDSTGRTTDFKSATGVETTYTYNDQTKQMATQFHWSNPEDTNQTKVLQQTVTYDAAGRPFIVEGPTGLKATNYFNELGKPVLALDARGNAVKSAYDARGNLIESVGPDGKISRAVYDANGRVIVKLEGWVPGKIGFGTSYTYDPLGRVLSSQILSNLIVSIDIHTNNGAVFSTSRYVSSGGVLATNLMAYDALGRMTNKINAQGASVRYEYDANGNTTAIILPGEQRSEFKYDATGHQTVARDPSGNETNFLYDQLGRVIRIVYPDGTSTQQSFDDIKGKQSLINEVGESKDMVHDAAGRLLEVTLPAVLDAEGTNGLARPVYSYTRDAYGNQRSITNPKGAKTRFSYDEFNRFVSRTLPLGQVSSQEYDNYGKVARTIDENGQVIEFAYDELGRQVETRLSSSASSIVLTNRFTYDDFGRQAGVVGADGALRFEYDSLGRMTAVISPEGTIRYAYDDKSGLKSRVWTVQSDVHYGYDQLGRLETVSVAKRNGVVLSPDETNSYTYDVYGNRVSAKRPNGITTHYHYDLRNRLIGLEHQNALSNLVASYSYTLDLAGKKVGIVEIKPGSDEALGTTNTFLYTYDGAGRLTSETNFFTQTNRSGFSAQYSYDLAGNRVQRKIVAGNRALTTSYTYDANDRLLTETNSTAAASLSAASGEKRIWASSGPNSPLVERSLPSAWTYYAAKSLPYFFGAAFLIPAGILLIPAGRRRLRLLTLDLKPSQALFPRCVASLMAALMAFNTSDLRVLATEAALYEALSTNVWGGTDQVIHYEYDAHGSVTKKVTSGSSESVVDYSYDLQNRLITASTTTVTGGVTSVELVKYFYSQLGSRSRTETKTTVNGTSSDVTTNVFLVDSFNLTGFSQVMEESPAVGAPLTRSYILADEILAQTNVENGDAETLHLLKDGHGSTRQLADANGVIVDSYAFDAFGVFLGDSISASNKTRLLYSGEYLDQETGQYNLRARQYDPANGRFTAADSFGGVQEDPVSLHRYTYTANDPVNHIDPSGNFSMGEVMTSIAIMGTLALIAGYALLGVGLAVNGDSPDAAIWGASLSVSLSGNVLSRFAAASGGLGAGIVATSGVAHLSGILGSLFGAAGGNIGEQLSYTFGPALAGVAAAAISDGLSAASAAAGGSLAQFSYNIGFEILDTTERKYQPAAGESNPGPLLSTWGYQGPGISAGSQAVPISFTISIYGGLVWGTPHFAGYKGPFTVVSANFGEEGIGAIAGFFANPNDGLQNGIFSGVTFGPTNAGFSAGVSLVVYSNLSAGTSTLAGVSAKKALLGAWPLGSGILLYLQVWRR